MCIIAFIAADVDLPRNTSNFLTVEEVADRHDGVQRQFSLANVAYLGARGCGCEFTEPAGSDDPEKSSRHYLVDYVDSILDRTEYVEIYSSWDGDQFYPCELKTEISLSELIDSPHIFQERQLVRVRRDVD
jgi:hypothetical protein